MASRSGGSSGKADSFQLQSKDLPSRRLLGKGLSGFGYETTWEGKRFARKDFVGAPGHIFIQEADALVSLQDHKNVVKTYGWTVDKRSCSLVLEYMDDDLLTFLQKKAESKQDVAGTVFGKQASTSASTPSFDLQEELDIILQIARGMEHLHEQKFVHGDLKTKNILISYEKDVDLNLKVVKVADFGLVRSKRNSKSIVSSQVRKLNIVKWKDPEYLKILFGQHSVSNFRDETSSESNSDSEETSAIPVVKVNAFAADVYSFAVTCSQILTGKDPYPNLHWKQLGDKILFGLRPKLLDSCPQFLSKLLTLCWVPGDPAQRPTFAQIRKELEDHLALPTAFPPPFVFQGKPKPILMKRKQSVVKRAIEMPGRKRRKMDVAASSSSKPINTSVTSEYPASPSFEIESERDLELDFQNPQSSIPKTTAELTDSFFNKPFEKERSPDSVLDEGLLSQEEGSDSSFKERLDNQVKRQIELDAAAPPKSWAPPEFVYVYPPIRKRVSRALKRCVIVSSDALKRPSHELPVYSGMHEATFLGSASDRPMHLVVEPHFYDPIFTANRSDDKIDNPGLKTKMPKKGWKKSFVRIPSKIQDWTVNRFQFCVRKSESFIPEYQGSDFSFPGEDLRFLYD